VDGDYVEVDLGEVGKILIAYMPAASLAHADENEADPNVGGAGGF
jgi:hypothetical protein